VLPLGLMWLLLVLICLSMVAALGLVLWLVFSSDED
jgi:hypothetical protein